MITAMKMLILKYARNLTNERVNLKIILNRFEPSFEKGTSLWAMLGELGKVSIGMLKLGNLGVVSFGKLKYGKLGEVSFGMLRLGKLGDLSFGMLRLGVLGKAS